MRRQIEYHLAHARAAASGATPGARCRSRESAEGLARRCCACTRIAARHRRGRPGRRTPSAATRRPRRDARQPARQRLQVGARARSRSTPARSDGVDGRHRRRRWPGLDPSMRERCCSAASAPTRPRRARASGWPSSASSPSSTAARSRSAGRRRGACAPPSVCRPRKRPPGPRDVRGDFGEPAYTGKGSGMFVSVLMILFCVSSWEAALAPVVRAAVPRALPAGHRHAIEQGARQRPWTVCWRSRRAPTRACTVCCRSLAGGFAMPPARTPSSRPRRCSMWMRRCAAGRSRRTRTPRSQFGLARQFVDLSVPSARSAGSFAAGGILRRHWPMTGVLRAVRCVGALRGRREGAAGRCAAL